MRPGHTAASSLPSGRSAVFNPLRRKGPRSFRTQLALSYAVLGAVLAVSLSVGLGLVMAQSDREDARTALQATAGHAARLLAEGLTLRSREAQILAESPTLWLDGLASERVAQVLYRSQALNPFSAWIGVVDARGTVRNATGGLLVGASVAQRPWFIAARHGNHVGDVHPAKLLGSLLPPTGDGGPHRFVDFAAPILRDGQLIGVIGIHGSWEWAHATLESFMPSARERHEVELFVFDKQGLMIYPSDGVASVPVDGAVRLQTWPATASGQASSRIITWGDGEEYLTSAMPMRAAGDVGALGWTIVARQPLGTAHAAARKGALVNLALGLVAALFTGAVGWRLSIRLTRPLAEIARDAKAVETAAMPMELPQRDGSAEVVQLSGALNSMTRRLLAANAELEQRVARRTAELEQANEALRKLADHDPLTGLLNRRGFTERLTAAVAGATRRGAPISLLAVDADHFKRVNDDHGHDAGDQVLQAIAAVLSDRLRTSDFVARLGGEEFIIVLPDTAAAGAAQAADALLAAIRSARMPAIGHITVSCGVAELAVGSEPVDAALRRADEALYQAKQDGRDRFHLAAGPRMAATGDFARA